MLAQVRPALVLTVLFTLLLGVVYPLAVTGVAQLAFPAQASGSLVRVGAQVVGSSLIAQGFSRPEYLQPRPSAAGAKGWDPTASSGSNLGPLNPDLAKRVQDSAKALQSEASGVVIPADAVTTSGSGLDPDVSPENANRQAVRIAQARGVEAERVWQVIRARTDGRWFGILGQPRVNVLAVNVDLDARFPVSHPKAQ